MRRLVIDEILKQAIKCREDKNDSGYSSNVELLRNIACSIMSTVNPSLPANPQKLEEVKFIVDCIKQLQQLAQP